MCERFPLANGQSGDSLALNISRDLDSREVGSTDPSAVTNRYRQADADFVGAVSGFRKTGDLVAEAARLAGQTHLVDDLKARLRQSGNGSPLGGVISFARIAACPDEAPAMVVPCD